MEIKTKATEILEKHLGKKQCNALLYNNEPLWDDIIDAINEALSINGVGKCVYVVVYNDNYGQPIYDNTFFDLDIANDYVKDHDYLRLDPTTDIKVIEPE